MSYLNIGSPHVDLVLMQNQIMPGSTVNGSFHLKSGWANLEIKRLECDLVKVTEGKKTETVDLVTTILMSKKIEAKEKTEIPFSYRIPADLPPSSEGFTYRLNTRLIFSENIKSFDHDEIVLLG